MNWRRVVWASISIILPCSIIAADTSNVFQSSKLPYKEKYRFVRAHYQWGKVLATNDFVKGVNESGQPIDAFNAFSIEFGRQVSGTQEWHHRWNMPEFGIGYYQCDYGADNDLGQPAAIYGFFNSPIKRWNKLGVFFEAGVGLTWNWNPYNATLNPLNIAIGSYNTVYFDGGLRVKYAIAKQWDLNAMVGFTHFSNGATTVPNSGINQAGTKLGVSYHFQKERPNFSKPDNLPEFKTKHNFGFSIKGAVKQVKFDTSITKFNTEYLGLNYGVLATTFDYHYHIKPILKLGGGIDLMYDGSAVAQLDVVDSIYNPVDAPFEYHFNGSVFGSVEIVIDRVSVQIQPGYYLIRKEIPNQRPAFYQRLLVNIEVYKGLFIVGGLRAYNFGVADFIEWGIGYRR